MNFNTFPESHSVLARVVHQLLSIEAVTSNHVSSAQQKSPSTPEYPPQKRIKIRPLPSLDDLHALQSACAQTRRVNTHQQAWNHEFVKLCRELGDCFFSAIESVDSSGDRSHKAKLSLREMKRKLKEADRLNPRRQRRWNTAVIAAIDALRKAYTCIGSKKLEQLGAKADQLKKQHTSLVEVRILNERSGRGLLKILGNISLDQRRVNHVCYRSLCSLMRLQTKLNAQLRKVKTRSANA